MTMKTALPDGTYPFIDKRYPMSELEMIEAPAGLETLLRSQAAANEIEIAQGTPIELRCQAEAYPDASFLLHRPDDDERLHILALKEFSKGRA